jgi:hypothetical protein
MGEDFAKMMFKIKVAVTFDIPFLKTLFTQ